MILYTQYNSMIIMCMLYRVETDKQCSRDSTPDPTTSTGLPLTPPALLSPSTSGSDHSESSATSSATVASVPSNLLLALGSCDMDSFPNIHSLLVLACTLPITSAEAERSFSLLRRIKTYTRSTLASEHLSDLAEMSMHYKLREDFS